MSAPQPETTDILGYYNRNPFPVVLSINAINVNVTVSSKKYLVNSEGAKINDPILRRSAKSLYGLTIELSSTPLPIVALPRPNLVIQSAGFGGVPNTTPEKATEAAAAPKRTLSKSTDKVAPAKNAVQGAQNPVALVSRENTKTGNPVRGMSAEEARAKGLILPTTSSNEGVEDNALELTGDQIPEIKIAQDIRGKRRPRPVVPEPTPEPTTEEEAMSGIETVDVADLTAKLKSQIETPVPVETTTTEEAAIQTSVSDEDEDPAVTALENAIASASESVLVSEPALAPATEPVQEEPAADEPVSTTAESPFSIDGKSFPSRSYLERHVKRKYPDKVDEIMARYPANRRAAKTVAVSPE